jgi:hypothetical protein
MMNEQRSREAPPVYLPSPAVDRDVVDLDPALGQELLNIPVGEAEPQVPADRQGDDFGCETVPGEGRTGRWVGVGSAYDLIAEVPLTDGPAPNATVAPHLLQDRQSAYRTTDEGPNLPRRSWGR